MSLAWICLFCAGLIEIVGAINMKKFALTGKKIRLLVMVVLFVISFSLLSFAMQEIPLGTAYAIWTGIGAGGIVVVGVLFFGESKKLSKLFFLALILFSTIGLKLVE